MARRDDSNDHTKSGQLRRRGQYRIQHEMMKKNDDDKAVSGCALAVEWTSSEVGSTVCKFGTVRLFFC